MKKFMNLNRIRDSAYIIPFSGLYSGPLMCAVIGAFREVWTLPSPQSFGDCFRDPCCGSYYYITKLWLRV